MNVKLNYTWSEGRERELFFRFWVTHINWLHSMGWKDARLKTTTKPLSWPHSQHRTVQYLREFVEKTGYANAHFGLTSSDVEDNVRLRKLVDATEYIAGHSKLLKFSFQELYDSPGERIPAFTHWQPAGLVSGKFKAMQITRPLELLLNNPPKIRGKHLGGPLGDNSDFFTMVEGVGIEKWGSFPWHDFGLAHPDNWAPIQSSDYRVETQFIDWCCAIAANVYKIAADMRFYASHGLILDAKSEGYRGSSSIPTKNNPLRFEKACSIATSISAAQAEMWQVTANNGCERTLNTSWNLARLLKRVTNDLCYALQTLLNDPIKFDFKACNNFQPAWVKQTQRELMTDNIISGAPRIEVYEKAHKQNIQQ